METKAHTVPHKLSSRTKGALWLLIAPTGLFITTFILFAFVNFFVTLLTPMIPDTEQMTVPVWLTLINVTFFIFGSISVVAWLPGLVAGIVLLSTKK